MRIQILDPSIFENVDTHDEVARLMMTIAEGWHIWWWPDPEDYRESTYFRTVPMHYEMALKTFVAHQAYGTNRHKADVYVIPDDESPAPIANRYRLREAAYFLDQPLKLLVENRVNDGKFLRAYIAAVDPDLADLFDADRPPMEFMHGGGKGELSKLIMDELDRCVARGWRPRLVVVCDSDARTPGHKDTATRLLERVAANNRVPIHVLRKRAIENYFPDRYFKAYSRANPTSEPTVDAILDLNPTQRDHYPIKNGLSELKGDEVMLYQTCVHLADGTAVKLPGIATYVLSQSRLNIDTEDLISRGCADESRMLASTIAGVL